MIVDRLRKLMKHMNMNQKQFAIGIRMDPGRLSKILSGKSSLSSRDFYMLQTAYRVNIDWLRSGEGDMFEDPISHKLLSPDCPALLRETVNELETLTEEQLLAVLSFINFLEENRDKYN